MQNHITIHDAVHGSVDLNEEETEIISHKYFQRLRRIKALGFLDRVFPSAKHSRFEHSIGACHVAGMLFGSLKKASADLAVQQWFQSSSFIALTEEERSKLFSSEMEKFIRIAALLHDIGHGPFSHASEKIMPPVSKLLRANKGLPKFVVDALKKSRDKKVEKGNGKDPAADHEDYSLILAYTILRDVKKFEPDEIQIIMSLKSGLVNCPKSAIQNNVEILRQLVDGEIDSDRMDYLLRDSKFCGVPYGEYDIKRLKEGLCVVKHWKTGRVSLGILRNALSAFEDFLFSRFQMHVQIYTHKVDASFNEAFRELVKKRKLPAKISQYARYDDESMVYLLKNDEDLRGLILNREKWSMAFQSYGGSDGNDAVVYDLLIQGLEKSEYVVYESERPFKKATLLDLPVIFKGFSKKLVAGKMTSSSQLITHYNAIFQAKRLFYKPSAASKIKAIEARLHERLGRPETIKELHQTRRNLKKLREKRKRAIPDSA